MCFVKKEIFCTRDPGKYKRIQDRYKKIQDRYKKIQEGYGEMWRYKEVQHGRSRRIQEEAGGDTKYSIPVFPVKM
jgi:hypothetical protein